MTLPRLVPLADLAERLRRMPAGSLVPAAWVVGELEVVLAGNGGPGAAARPEAKAPDRLLTAEQVAERLQTTPAWVLAHWKQQLPFGRKLGRRTLRFSERALERHLAQVTGRAS